MQFNPLGLKLNDFCDKQRASLDKIDVLLRQIPRILPPLP